VETCDFVVEFGIGCSLSNIGCTDKSDVQQRKYSNWFACTDWGQSLPLKFSSRKFRLICEDWRRHAPFDSDAALDQEASRGTSSFPFYSVFCPTSHAYVPLADNAGIGKWLAYVRNTSMITSPSQHACLDWNLPTIRCHEILSFTQQHYQEATHAKKRPHPHDPSLENMGKDWRVSAPSQRITEPRFSVLEVGKLPANIYVVLARELMPHPFWPPSHV
jgi:hypothetical protein